MIDFDTIEKHSKAYDLSKYLVNFQISPVYYKRLYVKGLENIPLDGRPMIIVSNHQNGLMDALSILASLPFKLHSVFLARADIFKKEKIAKILRWMRIMPVFRQRDGLENLDENAAIFNKAAQLVIEGYPVCLFPEAQHQEGHFLGSIKKGFARIAFDAAEKNNFPSNMVILPVGNHYEDYFAMHKDVLMNYGEPIALAPYYDLYRENPPLARQHLAMDVKAKFVKLMLDIDIPAHYETIDFLREAFRPEMGEKLHLDSNYFPHTLPIDQALVSQIHTLEKDQLETTFFELADTYKNDLTKLKIKDRDIRCEPIVKDLVKSGMIYLLTLPISLYGAIFSYFPLKKLKELASKKVESMHNKMLFASFFFVLTSIVFFPILFFICSLLVWIVGGSLITAILFWISLSLGKIFFLEHQQWREVLCDKWRAHQFIKKNPTRYKQLQVERNVLLNALTLAKEQK
ncbi:MAG: 1-acyl-sn-glycerol-3-phosphate acyltransferase [Bacteroidales bacterium]